MNFDFLFTSFGSVLAALYELHNSYAFMIIGLTLIVMVVVTPLTLKATRSMLMMQQLQPEMKRIQSQYKDDRQRLNEELLKFYKENNINPAGSCLPLLVQTPVFLVLYNVLRGLMLPVTAMGSNVGHGVGEHLLKVGTLTNPPHVVHTFDPQYLPVDSELYRQLHAATQMRSLGLDLARSAADLFSSNVVQSIPYLLLIAVVAVTGLVQQRQIQSRNSASAAINPQQQALMKIMPFFLPVFSFALPSGLVLYFVVSNTYRVGQQWFISRNIYGKQSDDGPAAEQIDEPVAYPAGGGVAGFVDRLLGREPASPAERPAPKAEPARGQDRPAKAPAGAGSRSKTSPAARSGRAKAAPGRPTERPPGGTDGAKRPGGAGKAAAAKGTRTSPAKSGRPAPAKGGDRARENGRGRGGSAGGNKTGSRTTNAPGSSGRAASPRKSAGSAGPESSTPPPTLQPRARKNKKR